MPLGISIENLIIDIKISYIYYIKMLGGRYRNRRDGLLGGQLLLQKIEIKQLEGEIENLKIRVNTCSEFYEALGRKMDEIVKNEIRRDEIVKQLERSNEKRKKEIKELKELIKKIKL
jgi:chromosome segregation ATPase